MIVYVFLILPQIDLWEEQVLIFGSYDFRLPNTILLLSGTCIFMDQPHHVSYVDPKILVSNKCMTIVEQVMVYKENVTIATV